MSSRPSANPAQRLVCRLARRAVFGKIVDPDIPLPRRLARTAFLRCRVMRMSALADLRTNLTTPTPGRLPSHYAAVALDPHCDRLGGGALLSSGSGGVGAWQLLAPDPAHSLCARAESGCADRQPGDCEMGVPDRPAGPYVLRPTLSEHLHRSSAYRATSRDVRRRPDCAWGSRVARVQFPPSRRFFEQLWDHFGTTALLIGHCHSGHRRLLPDESI
jgi:hypothetical protein